MGPTISSTSVPSIYYATTTASPIPLVTDCTTPQEKPSNQITINKSFYEHLLKRAGNACIKLDYTPSKIIYNGPATIVFWKDGTKTIVKRSKKEKDNKYNAFCAALAKKIFENNSKVNRIVNSGVCE